MTGKQDQYMVPKSTLVEEIIYSRSIFFLLVLQESDYEIEKDILIQLWMAEGCLDDDEFQGEEHFSFTLKHGCLIHSGTNLMTGEDTFRVNFRMTIELQDTQKHMSSAYLKWEHDEYQDSHQPTELIHISFVCNDSINGSQSLEGLLIKDQLKIWLLLLLNSYQGGSFINYYMDHGGTNLGRSAGGPFITTSYNYNASLDEYVPIN